ncbi:hypothetical protein HRbin17_01937 [bacterium HR17]|uniref:Uncharacterized protein n=1 Tax=Candidatus Fervidibacter japonicus TaxID=2035412 RepID=A0A2H5XE02_9BACT|nr:hypothetical protein HRbin17_01937 [bacterium HR17]
MKTPAFLRARQFHDCWAAVEWRFYERWMHGILWLLAGGLGLSAAGWILPNGWALALRLGVASFVLGIGLGVLRALGLSSLLQRAPDAFLRWIGGDRCPPPRRRQAISLYLRLMEGGFILLECLALFGLLGLSTTAAASCKGHATVSPLGVVLLVYGFFAVTYGGKNAVTAFSWARWLRPSLERFLEWECATWLVATGEWEMTRWGLLRPCSATRQPRLTGLRLWRGLIVALLICVAGLMLTLFVVALMQR